MNPFLLEAVDWALTILYWYSFIEINVILMILYFRIKKEEFSMKFEGIKTTEKYIKELVFYAIVFAGLFAFKDDVINFLNV